MQHNNITAINFFSGSSGNCSYIKAGNKEILLDVGKNCKSISAELKSISSDLENISDIFITHEHSDHISALPVILKHSSAVVHMTFRSAIKSKLPYDEYVSSGRMILYAGPFSKSIDDVQISSFALPHDSAYCLGYRFDYHNMSIGFATDCGCIPPKAFDTLCGCDVVVLEANYDEKMLKLGNYPETLKDRIASDHGHLSNPDCATNAVKLCKNGTKCIALAHLSDENNNAVKALDTLKNALEENKIFDINTKVLSRYEPTVLFRG